MNERGLLAMVIAGAAAVLGLWWHDTTILTGLGEWLTAAGRLTGLLGGYAVAVVLLLMSRAPWIEHGLGSDPHTRQPATTLASITVVGTDLAQVDAMGTVALAMGEACRAWLVEQAGLEGFVVSARGDTWWTPGFPDTGIVSAPATPRSASAARTQSVNS